MLPLLLSCRGCARPLVLALLAAMGVALAAGAAAADMADFEVSRDGSALIDQRAGLVWSRCVEGMRWSGRTCTGEPARVSHSKAVALASARKAADGVAWRLPRVTELQRLAPRSGRSPGLDPVLFPAAPDERHWAMTANIDSAPTAVNPYNYGNILRGRTSENTNQMAFLHGWAVNPETGEARSDVLKRMALPVRLVRTLEN